MADVKRRKRQWRITIEERWELSDRTVTHHFDTPKDRDLTWIQAAGFATLELATKQGPKPAYHTINTVTIRRI